MTKKFNESLKDIQQLFEENNINNTIKAGVIAMNNFKKGQMITQDEFMQKINNFLNKEV